jgi:hypothetical protein
MHFVSGLTGLKGIVLEVPIERMPSRVENYLPYVRIDLRKQNTLT